MNLPYLGFQPILRLKLGHCLRILIGRQQRAVQVAGQSREHYVNLRQTSPGFSQLVINFRVIPGNCQKPVPLQPATPRTKPVEKATCCIYHLGDLADDPNFGQWIANTIPDVIQPGSWNGADRVVRCYAPARILVVTHTPTAQAEVDAFLKSLKVASQAN